MCGISGYVGEGSKKTLKDMCDVMSHRGPDDEGYYQDAGIGLGARRLSVIDVEGGHQPIHNEEQTVWVIQNGEIYNYEKLRGILEGKGHHFYTKSDTEVIVHSYEEFGPDCVKKFNGMFAFAIWDTDKKILFIARDRVGKKPLYYLNDKIFAFASELKALLPIIEDRRIDLNAIDFFLTLSYIPSPHTIFEGVKKLPPAHTLTYSNKSVSIKRYWDVSFIQNKSISEQQCISTIRKLLDDSIRLRLASDVPLGAFLSGGLDSSIIVALMSRMLQSPVKTFTVGFEEGSFDEREYARVISDRCSTDHREFIVKPDILKFLPEIVWHMDEPFSDPATIPTYYLSKLTRKHVTVSLSGDGGDESFVGYRRYLGPKLTNMYLKLPKILRKNVIEKFAEKIPASDGKYNTSLYFNRFAAASKKDEEDRALEYVTIFEDRMKSTLYDNRMSRLERGHPAKELRGVYKKNADALSNAIYFDLRTNLPEQILARVDRMSMAHSLEVRAPLLDYRLVEYMSTVPSDIKLRGFSRKYLLKKCFRDVLPEKILNRGKSGFVPPITLWLRGELFDFAVQLLEDKRTNERGYMKPGFLKKMLSDHKDRKVDYGKQIWAAINLELWHRIYIDEKLNSKPLGSIDKYV